MNLQFIFALIAAYAFFGVCYIAGGWIVDRIADHYENKRDRAHYRFIQKVDRYYHEF